MKAKAPEDAKLVVSMFTGDALLFKDALEKLVPRFGGIDSISEVMAFDYTDYYKDEFGGGLKRRVMSFEGLVGPDALAAIKTFTNSVEDDFRKDSSRRINIDPGILTLNNFVLASCKNFAHRIYLSDGVYADLTLLYSKDGFKDLPWTYPDYRDLRMKSMLVEIRKRYALRLRDPGLMDVFTEEGD
jgi:hypothetical protein